MPLKPTPPSLQGVTRPTVSRPPVTRPATPTRGALPLKPGSGQVLGQRDHRVVTPLKTAPPKPAVPVVAPTPVAATAAEAVTLALGGQAVRLPLNETEAQGLALRELAPRGDRRVFEAGLGKLRLEVVMPATGDAPEVLARVLPMVAQIPAPVGQAVRRLTITQAAPETFAYRAELADAQGQLSTLGVSRSGDDGKHATYVISDATQSFELITPADGKDAWEVAQAFHLWAMIPPVMRPHLKTVRLEDGPNPGDEHWAKEFKNPAFTAAATASDGVITFYHGTKYLQEDYFLHEFGHVLGQTLSSNNRLIPDGWDEAMAADNRTITNYGANSANEDFAEAFYVYMTLKKGGRVMIMDPPQNLAGFTERWPRRAAIMDSVMAGTFQKAPPAEPKGAEPKATEPAVTEPVGPEAGVPARP